MVPAGGGVECTVYTVSNDSKQFGQAVVMPLSPHISPGKLNRIFPQTTPVLRLGAGLVSQQAPV